jgi:RNA polymerase sigma factor (sigma-70 family)
LRTLTLTEPNSKELVMAIPKSTPWHSVAGLTDWWNDLYERLLRFADDAPDRDDCVSEAVRRMLLDPRTCDCGRKTFARLARGFVRNVGLEHFRQLLRFRALDEHAELNAVSTITSPCRAAQREERLVSIGEALPRLSSREREVFIQFFIEERKAPEVAQSMGCSPAAVHTAKSSGLNKLRRLLGDS